MKKNFTMSAHLFFALVVFSSASSLFAMQEEKTLVTPDEVQKLSLELCQKVKDAKYEPDLLIGLSRGGIVPLGYLAGDHCFKLKQTRLINVESYSENNQSKELKFLAPINYEDLKRFKNILVVDELVDTGKTLSSVMGELRKNLPTTVTLKSAVLFDKPTNHKDQPKIADFHVRETADWLVMPWEVK